jgi:antitoxin component of MazEF toxin-antitoxin module
MKAKLFRIGKSLAVRLPARLIAKAGLSDDIEINVRAGAIVISSSQVRAGWAQAAKLAHARNDDRLLDPPISTRFDREEWRW